MLTVPFREWDAGHSGREIERETERSPIKLKSCHHIEQPGTCFRWESRPGGIPHHIALNQMSEWFVKKAGT